MHRKLTRNAAKCLKCGDTIESLHRHDFVFCHCEALAVDGGLSYAKRVTTGTAAWMELAEWAEIEVIADPIQVVLNWEDRRKMQLENSTEEND